MSGVVQEAPNEIERERTAKMPRAEASFMYRLNRKNSSAVSVVASANSSSDMPRAAAIAFGDEARVRRFAAFPAKRDRREIGTIGLDHEFPKRKLRRDLAHVRAVFESHDPGERNQMTERDNFIGLFRVPPKQWKTPRTLPAVVAHDFESIVPGIALMNDDIQPELDREIELLLETDSPV